MKSRTRQLFFDVLLLLVSFFWGVTFIVVKDAVVHVTVYNFLFPRFACAFALMAGCFWKRLWPLQLPTLGAGATLGAVLFSAFAFQTWGLTFTSATKTAFITGLNVVMVPVLSLLILRKAPSCYAAAGVITAALGLYILTGGVPSSWGKGEVLVFWCALSVAFHIILTGYYAPKHDALALATWQLGAVSALSFAFSVGSGHFTVRMPVPVWIAVAFTAVFATVFAFAVQTYAQRFTPPTRTALIFTGEPVFGALFAHWYGGEPLLPHHILGGGLIFLGMVLAQIRPQGWSRLHAFNQKALHERAEKTLPIDIS